MKKSIIAIFTLATLILTGLFIYQSKMELNTTDVIQVIIIGILALLGLFVGLQRILSVKKGEPVEDEYTKKILQKSASKSYYFSLYWWLVILYINNNKSIDSESLIGYGIVGMAVILGLTWLFYYIMGIRNE